MHTASGLVENNNEGSNGHGFEGYRGVAMVVYLQRPIACLSSQTCAAKPLAGWRMLITSSAHTRLKAKFIITVRSTPFCLIQKIFFFQSKYNFYIIAAYMHYFICNYIISKIDTN